MKHREDDAERDECYAPMTLEVGMGVTMSIGSDCYPYTIVLVGPTRQTGSPRLIVVQSDGYCLMAGSTESEDQRYYYQQNLSGTLEVLTLRDDGEWRKLGDGKASGYHWKIGQRRAYRDPCR